MEKQIKYKEHIFTYTQKDLAEIQDINKKNILTIKEMDKKYKLIYMMFPLGWIFM